MQNRIEPPFLMSRILTLVLATAVVVLIALVITLGKMFPLEHPEVFFLEAIQRNNIDVKLTEMPQNLAKYKTEFIKEYVKVRNEVSPNIALMQRKWNDLDGIVHTMSTPQVFNAFSNTDMWAAVMQGDIPPTFTCRVNFPDSYAVIPYRSARGDNEYEVRFYYGCDLDGQTYTKDYKIRIKIDVSDNQTIKFSDRLENPLGIKVVEYNNLDNTGDPLDPKGWVQGY